MTEIMKVIRDDENGDIVIERQSDGSLIIRQSGRSIEIQTHELEPLGLELKRLSDLLDRTEITS